MAELFNKQAKEYSQTRPSYPPELFQFIASKTPSHDLAWDVGTGSGQAAVSGYIFRIGLVGRINNHICPCLLKLDFGNDAHTYPSAQHLLLRYQLAEIYKKVVATDTSQQQLDFATKLPNICYQQTSTNMSLTELEHDVAKQASVDLVIVAQALHWFDHTTFYQHVNWVLRKPQGVLAVWCYTIPEVDENVDAVLQLLYKVSAPYWDAARKHVDNKYGSIHFPFEPVEGTDHTGPFEFVTKKSMDLNMYFTYIRSWSAYQTAYSKGIDLLSEEVVDEFKRIWGGNTSIEKEVRFPIYLMMGKVGK